jgi:hypothetical protein
MIQEKIKEIEKYPSKEFFRNNLKKMFRQDGKKNTPEEISRALNKSLQILK